jgi:lipoate-protein ligase A
MPTCSASWRTIFAPVFPDPPRKNDALFLYGALCSHPFVFSYVQRCVEAVYGPACKPEAEILLPECFRDAVAVHKRRSGGGAVVLSPGMVITIVVDKRGNGVGPLKIFSKVHEALIAILESQGISGVQKNGTGDLAINDKKILGSSLYLKQSPELYFYQSALMVDSDLSLIGKYLAHPPREPEYRAGRSHEDFCTTLKKAGYSVCAEEIAGEIGRELARRLTF